MGRKGRKIRLQQMREMTPEQLSETMRKVSHARKKKSEPEGCAGVGFKQVAGSEIATQGA